jgi:nucleoside 2-deoxyribosyltransferase
VIVETPNRFYREPIMNADAVTITLSAVPSEDGTTWEVLYMWDSGKSQRAMRFQTKQEADDWIAFRPRAINFPSRSLL